VVSGGTGNTIQNHQVGYAQVHSMYEQAYGADAKPLDGVLLKQDGIVNEQDKYRFHKPADVFYGFNTSVTYKTLIFNGLERILG
jgi:iron complex outermembrane receptor protein